jgi:pyruvate/2-oxoglutarate dehydrogenase complex dihydrolipoamide dehydrogenase (E3) component
MGEASFSGPKVLHVQSNDGQTRFLSAERIFLNLGTSPSIPATPGLREADPLTNITLLELDRLPAHLIVIGGGFVGLEFAQAFRRFGSQVTVLQRASRLLPNEDQDVSGEIQRILTAEGVTIITSANIGSVSGRSGDQVTVALSVSSEERTISGSDLLVATGRTPNTGGMGLDIAGVELESGGWIRVNERLETSAPGIWAIGECAGSPQFTHASLDDFRIIRDNLAGGDRSTRDRLMPFCLYTDPQVARVGLSEADAKRQGIAFEVLRAPTAEVLRTRTTSETEGFVKAIISPEDSRILGFTMIAAEAGEVMTAVQMAMHAGLPYTALADCVIAHPTMTEAINVVFSSAKARARKV